MGFVNWLQKKPHETIMEKNVANSTFDFSNNHDVTIQMKAVDDHVKIDDNSCSDSDVSENLIIRSFFLS